MYKVRGRNTLTIREISLRLGVCEKTTHRVLRRPGGPHSFKLLGRRRVFEDDLEAWLARQAEAPVRERARP